jgi:hypothetical protein
VFDVDEFESDEENSYDNETDEEVDDSELQ